MILTAIHYLYDMRKQNLIYFTILFFISINISAKELYVGPGPNAHERLQEAMILMNEGDTLIIEAGYYSFEDGLSLDIDGVTVVGRGMEETILDFKNQQSGAQGLLVTSNGVTLKDFAILDARSSERFYGKVPEPRPGLRSGHIPGSSNLPFSDLLCEDENAMLFKKNDL